MSGIVPRQSPTSGRTTYLWIDEDWEQIRFQDLQRGDVFCQKDGTGNWFQYHTSIVILAVSNPFETRVGSESVHTLFALPCPFQEEGFDLNQFLDRRLHGIQSDTKRSEAKQVQQYLDAKQAEDPAPQLAFH